MRSYSGDAIDHVKPKALTSRHAHAKVHGRVAYGLGSLQQNSPCEACHDHRLWTSPPPVRCKTNQNCRLWTSLFCLLFCQAPGKIQRACPNKPYLGDPLAFGRCKRDQFINFGQLSAPNHKSQIASDFKSRSPNRKNILQIAVKNASNRSSNRAICDLKPFSNRSRIAAPSPSNR